MKIHHAKWKDFCDVNWETNNPIPEDGVIHVALDHIDTFFRLIESTNKKYIVVSSSSDYGVEFQSSRTVQDDMAKFFHMCPTEGLGYNGLYLPSRHRPGHCNIQDNFVVKMYSYSNATFNRIPDNVIHWFGTNLNVDDPRITHIPFGVPDWTIDKLEKTAKDKFSIYINCQSNNLERASLKSGFRGVPDVIIEEDVPHEYYVQRLKECSFVLSPCGNGKDTFRVLESLYCGSIPVIDNDAWSKAYDGMPIIKTDNYFSCYEQLKDLWEKMGEKLDLNIDTPLLDMVSWGDLIQSSRELLT